jgi:glycerophosphoryl diester phosphodiesterase
MPRPVFDAPIAHRGLHSREAGVIENSRSAFALAAERGYAIECDVQLSRDGVPVVFHDRRLDRLTGRPGAVIEVTAAELAGIPLIGSSATDCPQRLDELLAQVGGRVLLQIELKRQTGAATSMLAKAVAEAVSGYSGPLVLESFDPALIVLTRRFGFRGPRGIITEAYDRPGEHDGVRLGAARRGFLRGLWHFPVSNFDFISAHHGALDLPAIRFWRALGKPVTAWTIRSPAEAAAVRGHADQIVFEGFDPAIG